MSERETQVRRVGFRVIGEQREHLLRASAIEQEIAKRLTDIVLSVVILLLLLRLLRR